MEPIRGIRLPDYLVILAYFLIITGAGYRLAKTVRKTKDYFAAGDRMPWWLAGTSYYMASFSTMMFVIYSEISYNYGIVGMTICWFAPPAFLLGAHFTALRWRRARVLTPLGFIEKRFSPGVHQLFVWTGFPLRMVDNSLRLYSAAIVMAVAVGGTQGMVLPVMAVIGIIMILYSFMGGQVTVVVTDFIQASILVAAVILLFVLTLGQIGNLGRFFGRLPPEFLNPANHYGWSYLIFTTFLIWFLSYNASWSLVQKYNIVRSERDISKMVRLIAILLLVSPPVFFLPGLAAKVLLPGLANPKEVYAVVSMKLLPLGMMGLVIAALLSATMSTMGSEYNTLSGVLTRDFYRRRINPRINESQEIRLGRIFTVLIGIVTILIGILLSSLRGLTLMDIAFRFMSAFAPPIMIPLIFGLLFRRFNARGVIVGVIAGAVTGSILVLSNLIVTQVYADAMKADAAVDFWLRSAWNSAATVANILATVAGMWFGSRKPAPAEEQARAAEFFSDLGKPFQSEEESGRGWNFALKIIPGALTAFGLILAGIAAFVRLSYADPRAFRTGLTVALAFVAAGAGLHLLLKQAGRPSTSRIEKSNPKEKEPT